MNEWGAEGLGGAVRCIGLWHQKFRNLEQTGPERETEREDFGVSDNGARLEGTHDLLTLTSSSHVPWENLDLVFSLEEEEHRAV